MRNVYVCIFNILRWLIVLECYEIFVIGLFLDVEIKMMNCICIIKLMWEVLDYGFGC